jgi:hypothetical protein
VLNEMNETMVMLMSGSLTSTRFMLLRWYKICCVPL